MSVCVLDTDVVIAALDRRDAHHGKAARVIEGMSTDGTALLLSAVCQVRLKSDPFRPVES